MNGWVTRAGYSAIHSLAHSLKAVASEHQILVLVERLDDKIRVLRELYAGAKDQIKQLEREKDALQSSLKAQQERVIELQKKTDKPEKNTSNSKDSSIIVKDNLSVTDTNAELKHQLDEYIRELERCIAHLSSLS
jgi:chromosome segregation ATPase